MAPHFAALYRAAYRLTRRRPDAEDLVQEACLRACRELDTLASLEYVRGWLLRVQYRVFVDGVRRRVAARTDLGAAGDVAAALASDEPGPEELTAAAFTRERLDEAWQQLTVEQRALLALHAEGYGLAELEAITGKTRNVLSVRLHRARNRLAKLIGTNADDALPTTCLEKLR